jgi:secreted trypsin-like serine protease
MKKLLLFLVVVLMVVIASPAAAITNGTLDGESHPFVGIMVAKDSAGNPLWRCSGTLLSPYVFLTAGHCTEAPAASAEVWFEADVGAGRPGNGYPNEGPTSVSGTTYVHPQFDPNNFLLHDLGVVVLDEPVQRSQYGQLPEQGALDTFMTRRGKQDATVTAVGYGLQRINPVFVESDLVRYQATLRIIGLRNNFGIPEGTSMAVSANANTGGTCFGDSGGPQFLNNTNIVVAVTSFGINGNCAGIGGAYRVDQADDLNWLYSTFGSLL